jgi:DNA polymerase-3 subunit gamma/tau
MARLLAKALMCEQGAGHLPDGTCDQCKLIAAGEHPDVYELDAASRTGVDSVREEIINSVSYAPTQGSYKVYIIDEVHMLTTAAFNALLKTLEEPPSHVVFVLCTTDPQKIPATILSRVQRFDFRPIGNDDIHEHLVRVCTQEGFTYEDAALELVTTNARGGMRDALSTLEQLSVFGGGVIGLEAAQDLLGAVSGMALEHVVDAIAARDVAGLFVQVGELVDAGRDLLQFTRELAARMRDIYVVAVVGQRASALSLSTDVQRLQMEARAFGTPDRLSRILALLGDVSREMSTAPNQRLVLEIAFTRMARPESDLTIESLAERVGELEMKLAGQTTLPRVQRAAHQAEAPASQTGVPASHVPGQALPADATARPQPLSTSHEPRGPQQAEASNQRLQSASTLRHTTSAQDVPRSQHGQRPQQTARVSQSSQTQYVRPEQPVQGMRTVQPTAQVNPTAVAATVPAQADAWQAQVRPAAQQASRASASMSARQRSRTSEERSVPQPATSGATSRAITDPGELQRSWRKIVSELMNRLPARGTLLANAVVIADNGSELVVGLPKGSSFALRMLERPDMKSTVEHMVAEVFGPRAVTYREGIGENLQVPAQRRGAQGSHSSPSATRSSQSDHVSVHSAAYAPAPSASAQNAGSAPRPAQGSWQAAASAQQAPTSVPDYPMPWDAPMQPPAMPSEEPYYEQVPYEDLGGFAEEDEPPFESSAESGSSSVSTQPSAASGPMPAPRGQGAPASFAGMPKRSSSAGETTYTQSVQSVAASAQAPRSSSSAQAAGEPSSPSSVAMATGQEHLREVPNDLPPELSAILENAFEVFGDDVRVSRS